MTWIVSAVLLGLILGVIGYFYTRAALVVFASIITFSSFFLTHEFTFLGTYGTHIPNPNGYAVLGKILSDLPEHIQWSGLLFVISFFIARIITWFLSKLGIVPEFGSHVDRVERGIEEYSYGDTEVETFT